MIRIGNTNFTYEVVGAPHINPNLAANPAYEPTVAAAPPSFEDYHQVPQQGYPEYPQQPLNYQGFMPPAQQPYAPQAGQIGIPSYAAELAQPRRRSRLGLWTGLIVILLLVAPGVGGYLYLNRSTP